MFVRNGEALGSVRVEPKAEPEPQDEPEQAAPVVESEPEQSAETASVARPKDYDNKPEWVDYAISKGADPAEAEGLTKPELIELYGGEE